MYENSSLSKSSNNFNKVGNICFHEWMSVLTFGLCWAKSWSEMMSFLAKAGSDSSSAPFWHHTIVWMPSTEKKKQTNKISLSLSLSLKNKKTNNKKKNKQTTKQKTLYLLCFFSYKLREFVVFFFLFHKHIFRKEE